MHFVTLALALLAAAPSATHRPVTLPATLKPFTLEHALTLKSYADPTWSPDGSKLAFVVTLQDTAENTTNQDLWLVDLAANRTLRLTRHAKNDFSPTFSPSGDTIAFVGNRATGDDPKSAIYMMSLHGGEPWAFGPTDESISEVEWSPDGRSLAFVKLDTLTKSQREWRKKKWDQTVEDQVLQRSRLWVVDVASGKKRQLSSGETTVWNVRWSPDSRSIACIVSPTGHVDDGNANDVGIVLADGGPLRTLGVIGASFTWSPDSRWIAVATSTDRAQFVGKSDLFVASVSGGAPINLTASFDEDADLPAWSPNSDTLYFHSAQGVTTKLASVAIGRDGRARGPVTLSTDRAGEAGAMTAAGNGRVAWIQSDPSHPNEAWVADHAGARGRAITDMNAEVSRLALGTTRSVQWTSSDGAKIEGVLLRPPGAPPTAALKTLVLLHGGPYTSRYSLSFQAQPMFLAVHGYQIFMPNFRSSGGYGTAFMMRARSDWGGQDWRDVMTGIGYLVKQGLADPQRLGVYGHSYGGYLSAWAITQTDRFDAAIVSAGAVDLPGLYAQSDTHRYRAFEFEGMPWVSPQNWARSSPITYITKVKTPTLVFAGDEDRRVPFPQGQQLYQALSGLKVPTEFVHYPREPHGYREYHHIWDRATRSLAWWDRWIK